ncbi:hypothetical protein [Novosphingobium sp. KA1]|uniref:hypothetical protein n=1 Tax=Novosphingobium sp. (strain KA1) TaxID=164608 RepID=UPI001A908E22|nr:hypothetical protein [Novosphingobium sp. KA1]
MDAQDALEHAGDRTCPITIVFQHTSGKKAAPGSDALIDHMKRQACELGNDVDIRIAVAIRRLTQQLAPWIELGQPGKGDENALFLGVKAQKFGDPSKGAINLGWRHPLAFQLRGDRAQLRLRWLPARFAVRRFQRCFMGDEIKQIGTKIGCLPDRQRAQHMSCGMREMPGFAGVGGIAGFAQTGARGHGDDNLPDGGIHDRVMTT